MCSQTLLSISIKMAQQLNLVYFGINSLLFHVCLPIIDYAHQLCADVS
jgi:hypothetical protein